MDWLPLSNFCYLKETQHNKIKHITSIERVHEEDFVWMDKFTINNLELYHSNNQNAVTLIQIIDKTISQWEVDF